MSAEISAVLAERGTRYGEFKEHARITQNLKRAMADSPNWGGIPDFQKEALEMVAHKIGRLLNGDFMYEDNLVDILGYGQLALEDTRIQNQVAQSGPDEHSASSFAQLTDHELTLFREGWSHAFLMDRRKRLAEEGQGSL